MRAAFQTAEPTRLVRTEIYRGTEFSGDSRAADMQIRNIREKIEPDLKNPRYVLTVRGMGYKFAEI